MSTTGSVGSQTRFNNFMSWLRTSKSEKNESKRSMLVTKTRILTDCAAGLALAGIALTVLEHEIVFSFDYTKQSGISMGLKLLITLSTSFLLCFIVAYHALEVQLFLIDNSAEDWRLAITFRRISQILFELLVCAICPLPGDIYFNWSTVHSDGETVTTTAVPLDVILSIPMFMRFYLLGRVLLLHSKLITDASSRSIGAMNRINFNTQFVLKNYMTVSPGMVLCIVTLSFWIVSAWTLRLCERHHVHDDEGNDIIEARKHVNYLNSIWFIAITFLSVGYGDMVPNTYCGRTVAVITGILGAGTSSLVVAVVAQKLELSSAEKHVHNFMQDTTLTKQLKEAAANVLRETWLIYKNRKLVKRVNSAKIRTHQRKFLVAIYQLRKVKIDQRRLMENSVSVSDIARTTTSTYDVLTEMQTTARLETRITTLESQMKLIRSQVQSLPLLIAETLRDAPDFGLSTPIRPANDRNNNPPNPFLAKFFPQAKKKSQDSKLD